MSKLVTSRVFVSMSLGLILLFAVVGTALANWVNLNATHSCAPTQGNFSWTEPYLSNNVEWYQHEKWTGSQYNCIHGALNWYHLETEAYKPPSSHCDKLHAIYTNYTLPSSGAPSIGNGCGSSSYKEEIKFWISSSGIGNGTNYWTFVRFNKVNPTIGTYEVNWSFSNLTSDWWLAKIGYNIISGSGYPAYCSNPLDILTGKPTC